MTHSHMPHDTASQRTVTKFSKYMLLAPCRTIIDMPQAAKLLLNMLLPQHAMPEAIVSDRDPRFTGSMWPRP